MHNSFNSILKIEKNKLEGYIGELNKLLLRKEDKTKEMSDLLDNCNKEVRKMSEEKGTLFNIVNFNDIYMKKKNDLESVIDDLDEKIYYAQKKVQDQFAEVKKIEIIIKKKKTEYKKYLEDKYQKELDEIKSIRRF